MTRKRPAAFAAPPKKRLRGKQEALSFNEDLPKKFLAWRSQHIYAAYKNLGGAKPMDELADDLALTEPNPAHYAEYIGIYVDGCLAAEGQPPIAFLGLLVQEWAAELTVAEWRTHEPAASASRKRPATRKRPAGRRGKTALCQGCSGDPCRFSAKEAGRPSRVRERARSCLLCREAHLKQSLATPQGRGSLVRALKALRAHNPALNIFEAACDRLALWLSPEAVDALRAKAAARSD